MRVARQSRSRVGGPNKACLFAYQWEDRSHRTSARKMDCTWCVVVVVPHPLFVNLFVVLGSFVEWVLLTHSKTLGSHLGFNTRNLTTSSGCTTKSVLDFTMSTWGNDGGSEMPGRRISLQYVVSCTGNQASRSDVVGVFSVRVCCPINDLLYNLQCQCPVSLVASTHCTGVICDWFYLLVYPTIWFEAGKAS